MLRQSQGSSVRRMNGVLVRQSDMRTNMGTEIAETSLFLEADEIAGGTTVTFGNDAWG